MKIVENFLSEEELYYCVYSLMEQDWHFIDDFPFDEQPPRSELYKKKSLGVSKDNPQQFQPIDYWFIDKVSSLLNMQLDPRRMRILINCFRSGDSPAFHQDSDFKGRPTFILFVNPEWKWWWGSPLTIKNGWKEKKIRPKPGRLVIFDGNKWHKGSPPSIFYRGPGRFSFVIQYQDKLPIV